MPDRQAPDLAAGGVDAEAADDDRDAVGAGRGGTDSGRHHRQQDDRDEQDGVRAHDYHPLGDPERSGR